MSLPEEPPAAPRRRFPVYFFELFILSQVLLAHVVLYLGGLRLGLAGLWITLRMMLPQIAVGVAVGVVIRLIVARVRGDLPRLRRRLLSLEWLTLTARLIFFGALSVHVYAWIKLTVPILNGRSFDQALYRIETSLFGGHSPNALIVNLFSYEPVFRTIDWLYGKLFLATLFASFAIFMSMPASRLRVKYATGSSILWIAGAWLYLLVPSIGPTYRFPDIWNGVRDWLPTATYTQLLLIRNYDLVLQIPRTWQISPDLNLVYGVAAFPSLHVGFQTFVALWISRLAPRWRLLAWVLVAVMFLGSVLTGWHYLIDSIVGAGMAVGCFYLTRVPRIAKTRMTAIRTR